MFIRNGGEWKYSEPSIKHEGEWKHWLTVYSKIDDEWVVVSDNSTWSLFQLEWEDDLFWSGI